METWREARERSGGKRFSETGKETNEGGCRGDGGGKREGREHIRLKDLQWLYISQCLVKAARQGSENLIIA